MKAIANRILLTLSALLKDNLRNRFVIFWVIVFPLLLTIIFALVFGGFSSYLHVGVITNNYGLAKYINSSGLFYAIYGSNGRYAITHGFIYVNYSASEVKIIAPNSEEEFVKSLSALISTYQTSNDTTKAVNIELVKGFSYYAYLISGMVGVVALSDGILGVIGVSAGYYRDRLVERLASSPLSSAEWSLSIILYTIVVTLISTALIFILGLLYGFYPIVSLEFLGTLVVSTLMFGGLGAIIYGLTPKDKIFLSEVVANVFVFPLIFLSNVFFSPLAYPPYVRPFIEYQPLSLVTTIIRDLVLYSQPPNIINTFALLVATIVFVGLGVRLLRLREIE